MSKRIDLTGQRFGWLVVIESAENTSAGQARWRCRCDCGRETIVRGDKLRRGYTVSCGHYNGKNPTTCRTRPQKHRNTHTRLYNIWAAMKQRCYNPHTQHYARYGGRGITVCDEWLQDFQKFWDWAMTNGYQDKLSIDRIDNDKGYSPDNCRWASQKEQANNISRNRRITFAGQTLNLSQWCEALNIDHKLVDSRLRRGWSPEEALGLVPRKK